MKKKSVLILLFILCATFVFSLSLHARRGGSIGGFRRPSSPSSFGRSSSSSRSSYGSPFRSGGGLVVVGGGGNFLPILIIGGLIFIIFKVIGNRKSGKGGTATGERSHLYHLQLGFYFRDGALENELLQLGRKINTGNTAGLVQLLHESTLSMKRKWADVRWYNFTAKELRNFTQAESEFRNLVHQERMKLDTEEFSDKDGVEIDKKQATQNLEELIVINIIVSSSAIYKTSGAPTMQQAESFLGFLGSIPAHTVMGVDIVWNIMDQDDMLELFPEMRTF